MTEKKPSSEKILSVKDLSLYFNGDYGKTHILNRISFDLHKGETLGIVGESGCGKSMTASCIMRLLDEPPAVISGSIQLNETDILRQTQKAMQKIRGNKMSMIFQDPMTCLNPVFTIGQQLDEVFMLHQGMSRKESRKCSIDALRMVHVAMPEKRIDSYPYEMSGGMRQRVMIAMALACRPQLLIADEPTTALDVTIQAQVLDLMRKLRDETGTAIILITHDLGVVNEMCSRAVVLYCGEVVEDGSVKLLLSNPRHPYTQGLLSSLPHKGSRNNKLYVIPGMVPPAGQFPTGCVFAPRCQYATAHCYENKPSLTPTPDGGAVRCFKYNEGSQTL